MSRLSELFHHKWAAQTLLELVVRDGAKFVTLHRSLSVTPAAMRATLDALSAAGLVERNPGYGHPLRPEYILTERGLVVGPLVARLIEELGADRVHLTQKKWPLPILVAMQPENRFSELAAAIDGLTDRGLMIGLRALLAAGLVNRVIEDSFPPIPLYQRSPVAEPIRSVLLELEAQLG